jgi:hypothetical protein
VGKDSVSAGLVGGLSGLNLNVANKFQASTPKENGNCERYYDKISADEWVPDTLVPLAFDRASEAKVDIKKSLSPIFGKNEIFLHTSVFAKMLAKIRKLDGFMFVARIFFYPSNISQNVTVVSLSNL